MAVVAKTVLIFASEEDRDKVLFTVPWKNFLQIVGDGGPDDYTVIGNSDRSDPIGLSPTDLTVTRKWENKKNAQDYIDWMYRQFANIAITPVSFTVEDYTE